MWQKCPICEGTGRIVNTLSSSTSDICSTCNGTKIISEKTGLPPEVTIINVSNLLDILYGKKY